MLILQCVHYLTLICEFNKQADISHKHACIHMYVCNLLVNAAGLLLENP